MQVMTLCNAACSASLVGWGTSTNSRVPSVPHRYMLNNRVSSTELWDHTFPPAPAMKLDQYKT